MQAYVQYAYLYAGQKTGLTVIPAGAMFGQYVNNLGSTSLLLDDQKHPSNTGYYLLANSFYQYLFNEQPHLPVEIDDPDDHQEKTAGQNKHRRGLADRSARCSQKQVLKRHGSALF